MNTFEDFLRSCLNKGHVQVKVVPRIDANGKIAFYAVGQCGIASSETFDAVVEGKHVRRVVDIPVMVEDFSPPMTEEELEDFALSKAGVADVGDVLDAEDEE